MEMLIEAGYPKEEMDHHDSDLYVYVTPLTTKVIEEWCKAHDYRMAWHCPTFKDQITGKMMYDCAFQWYENQYEIGNLERGLTCMNELDRIIKDLSESIEDDQKYMEEEFETVRNYCIKREFKLSEDEMKTIKSIGLEDWIEGWRNDYEEV